MMLTWRLWLILGMSISMQMLATAQPQGVLIYAERISDGEVVATVVRAPMKAGVYEFALNLQKLVRKGIELVWSIGEGKQQRVLLK